jgi:hypothetical protein
MTNRTRLDSLRVGERFTLPGGSTSMTVLEPEPLQALRGKTRVVSNVNGHILYFNDTRMVVPLDPPPPVPAYAPSTVHRFTVTVMGCTAEEAAQVMAERIGYDEDYGFTYTIDCRMEEQP